MMKSAGHPTGQQISVYHCLSSCKISMRNKHDRTRYCGADTMGCHDGDVLVTMKTGRIRQRHDLHKHPNFYRSKSLKRYGSCIEPLQNRLTRPSLLCFVFRCRDWPACTQWRMSATMSSELQPHVWLGWRNISQRMCPGGSRVQVSVLGIFDLGDVKGVYCRFSHQGPPFTNTE